MACLDLLEKAWPRAEAPTMMGPPPDDDIDGCDLELEMPRHFGRFEIRRLVGRGGFAVVYLAYDPHRQREVALKIPRPDVLVSAELRMRFFREAQALAALEHPNIVSIYEAGEIGPACYLTSAFCNGPTLEQWICLRNQPIDERVAAGLVEMLANAMQHAHERGILHRDIKPGNVILERGIPRLTDFGLAKIAQACGDDTRTGAVLGTPKYMAPEQARSRNRDIGPRTDVYSLGAILYELLTGRPPFEGTSDFDVIFKVLWTDPVPVNRHRPGVSRDLGAICQKCMEKRPEGRYASAGELAIDLRRYLDGQRTSARPLGLLGRSVRWARKSRARTGLVLVSIAALFLIACGVTWHTIHIEHLLAEAEKSRAEARANAAEVAHSNQILRRHLYASSMRQAREALKNGETKRALYYLSNFNWDHVSEDLRGFEWHYLQGICNRQRLALLGHDGPVYTVSFSPDAASLVSGGADGTIREWDPITGALRRTYAGHEGDVNAIEFFGDGRRFASVGDDQTLRIWDRASGHCERTIRTEEGNLYAICIAQNMNLIAVGGTSGKIVLWEVASGEKIASWPGRTESIDGLRFANDDRTLVCGGRNASVRVWDINSQAEILSFKGHRASVTDVELDAGGTLVASAGWDSMIRVWDLNSGTERVSIPNHMDCTEDVVFDPSGARLATCGTDDLVRIWDLGTGELSLELPGHSGSICALAFHPDGEELVSAGKDGTIRIWNLNKSIAPLVWTANSAPIDRVAFCSENRFVATAGTDGRIFLWDSLSNATPEELGSHRQPVRSLAFAPQGGLVASCCHGDTLRLWDVRTRPASSRVLARNLPSASMQFSSNGEWILVGTADGQLRLLSVATGEERGSIEIDSGPIHVALFPDERHVVVGRQDGVLEYWDFEKKIRHGQAKVHREAIHGVDVSSDGKFVATAGGDRIVSLLAVNAFDRPQILEGHHGEVTGVAFAPDSRTLASAAADGSVLLWNVATGRLVAQLEPPLDTARTVAFSPDGKTLLATGRIKGREQDGLVLWKVSGDALPSSLPDEISLSLLPTKP
jgi:WD40 repeat protein